MDDKPCIPSADTELLISEVTDSLKEVTLETDLSIQKSTRTPTEDISEAFLLQVISVLKSLDADITNSIRISRKNMYFPNIPGMTSSGNSTTKEEDSVAESASSTSSEMIGAVDESAKSTSHGKTGAIDESAPSRSPERTGAIDESVPSMSSEKIGAVDESAPSTSHEKTGVIGESAPSTSPEETGNVANENPCENGTHSKGSTCSYFHQMDRLFDMQWRLLVIRRVFWYIVKDLLVHCNEFKSCEFREIEALLDQFDDLVKERELMEENFQKEAVSYSLALFDAIGAVRISSQMMYFKYLLLENDKFIQTFKGVQILMTQLMRSRICLQKEVASCSEMKETQF
ncbi:hypothetical protein TNCT_310081 [Trichonephila clavata]|uniref:Uncharacterized protein n=1 Tax=Trichonephila clavata TaxID=2740835 RepID=A0A8X6KDM4_TRICU|nr:hypothetical protein TNCT_310081 [Trichonephila clavata]